MLEAEDKNKDAQILCGDAVANFRTIQSFGNEDLVVDLYKEFLSDEQARLVKNNFVNAMISGGSQFVSFIVIGGLFFSGGLMVHLTRYDEDPIKASDVFASIFPIQFGALQMANALSLLGDLNKAKHAADTIFKMI